jgi:twinkle protein
MTNVLPLTPSDAAWLKARGLDPVLAAQLGVRSMPGRDGQMVMAFDYRLRGQLHNTKKRYGKGDMPWEEKDRRLILWGLDDLAPPPRLNVKGVQNEAPIIVEGEPDRIALIQAGYSRVVSVPNGAPSKDNQQGDKRYQYLYAHGTELLPDLAKWETYILAVDGDRPGMALRDDLAVRLGDTKCLWVKWPDGCKDANDVLLKHGVQALRDCINGAKRMWLDLISSMSDIPEQPPEVGLPLGLQIMDNELDDDGIRLGETGLCTIVGPAGSGKSTFARQILWNRWRLYGRRFAITALEEPAKPRYQHIFRRYAIGKPERDNKGNLMWTQAEIDAADAEIDAAMKIIRAPPDRTLDVDTFLGAVEYAIKVYGVQDVLLDPINELEFDEAKRTDVASKNFIMEAKRIAEKFRVLLVAVTHPPMDVFRRKKAGELWTLYDVEGGRHGPGKSDFGFGVWRPHPRGLNLINFCKSKNGHVFGPLTLYMANYDREMDRYKVVRSGYDCIEQIMRDADVGGTDQPPPFRPRPSTGRSWGHEDD